MSSHPTNQNIQGRSPIKQDHLNNNNYKAPLTPQNLIPSSSISNNLQQKIIEYESQINKLRIYVKENDQLKKKDVCNIFNWHLSSPAMSNENLVKKLGFKIKNAIKALNIDKSMYNHEEIIYHKKKKNLQNLINAALSLQKNNPKEKNIDFIVVQDQYQQQNGKPSSDKYDESCKIKNDKSSPLKKFTPGTIKRQQELLSKGKQLFLQPQSKSYHTPYKPKKDNKYEPEATNDLTVNKTDKNDEQSLSYGHLKKNLLAYVNLAIEENDDNFTKMQKYLNALEKRVAIVQKVEKHLQHFIFQKTVKLQQSSRKSKNYCYGGPKVIGDQTEHPEAIDLMPSTLQLLQQQQQIKQNQKFEILWVENDELKRTIEQLKIKNINLQKELQILKKQVSDNQQVIRKASINALQKQMKISKQFIQGIEFIHSAITEFSSLHYINLQTAYNKQVSENKEILDQCHTLRNQILFITKASDLLGSKIELTKKYELVEHQFKEMQKLNRSEQLQVSGYQVKQSLPLFKVGNEKLELTIKFVQKILQSFKQI